MKKLTVALLALACSAALTLQAAEGKAKLTPEQKSFRKEMIEKYDTNKDGKLDKEERAKMSKEDKAQWQKLFPHKGKKAETETQK